MKMGINGRRARFAALGILMLVFFLAGAVQAGTIQIPAGTKVKLKFPPDLRLTSGNVSQGIPVICFLAEPINIGGIVVVEEGAQGTATVTEVKPAKSGGKPGQIKIEFTSLQAKGEYKPLTGDQIKLKGIKEAKGKGKGFFPYLFFVFLMKGSQGVIPTNAIYTVDVAESIVMQSE